MYRDEDYARTASAAVRSGVVPNSFINRVFSWMFIGLAVTGGISWYLGTFQQELILRYFKAYWIFCLAEVGLVIALSAGIRKFNTMLAALLFMVFAALNGVTLSWIFIRYSSDVIAGTFFATSGTFGVMGLIGYLTKKDLSSVGGLCTMGLFGVIIASLVNVFWYNRTADLIISCIGVLIFVGLTAWDVQKIKLLAIELSENSADSRDVKKWAVLGALTLYLDFINLFLFMLRLFNGGRR